MSQTRHSSQIGRFTSEQYRKLNFATYDRKALSVVVSVPPVTLSKPRKVDHVRAAYTLQVPQIRPKKNGEVWLSLLVLVVCHDPFGFIDTVNR